MKKFENLSGDEILDQRKRKFLQIGRDQGFKKLSREDKVSLSYIEPFLSKLSRVYINKKNILILGLFVLVVLTIRC